MNYPKRVLYPLFLVLLATFLLLFSVSCAQEAEADEQTVENSPKDERVEMVIQPSVITSQSLPELMIALAKIHRTHLIQLDSTNYYSMCAEFNLDAEQQVNQQNYTLFLLAHKLLTAEGASTGSMGKILKIPYYWHYTTPNPRHSIQRTSSGKWLRDIPPPSEFKQYPNFAGIDRTPFLYLSDAFAETPRYFSAQCDSFSSFGWCSEREMAYNALLKTLGFQGKVYTMGIHCWSEFLVPMRTLSGDQIKLDLKVDNTFDVMQWRSPIMSSVSEWEKDFGSIKERYWYNKKASDPQELNRIRALVVSEAKCNEVERKIVEYLNQ